MPSIAANVTGRTATLTHLTPNTNYTIGVSAVTLGGASAVAHTRVFLTLESSAEVLYIHPIHASQTLVPLQRRS